MARKVSNGPYSITTAPSLTRCRHCSRPMLAATVSGVDEHVDTATLNDQGELAALLDGRRTYELVGDDYLVRRGVLQIKSGKPMRPVLADHTCAGVPAAHIATEWTELALAVVYTALGARPVDNTPVGPAPF